MRKNSTFGNFLLAVLVSAAAFSENPAGPPATPQVPANIVLEKARELRKRSDQGDADAAFDFGLLLLGTSSGRTRLDAQQKVELRELSDGLTATDWMLKAAKAGSKPGIEFACSVGKDVRAPADLRQQGQEACEQAGKK